MRVAVLIALFCVAFATVDARRADVEDTLAVLDKSVS
jgi:hypothetical protein